MYFYNANKSHLNKHQSRTKVLDDFVNSKSMHLDGFMENEHVCKYNFYRIFSHFFGAIYIL